MRWPEARIREEIERLDRKTGLHGNDLDIRFNNVTQYLATFTHSLNGNAPYFTFSIKYLEDDAYTNSVIVDLIRHEYAHYMVYTRYPGLKERSHGRTWQKCCLEIGAEPKGRFDPAHARRILEQEKQQEADNAFLHSLLEEVHTGDRFRHPIFGEGVVTGITPHAGHPRITLTFTDDTRRLFSARWVLENCAML